MQAQRKQNDCCSSQHQLFKKQVIQSHRSTGKVDILMITETKFDVSFPIDYFINKVLGENYRVDRNANCGGVMLFVRGHSFKTCFYRKFCNRGFLHWEITKK